MCVDFFPLTVNERTKIFQYALNVGFPQLNIDTPIVPTNSITLSYTEKCFSIKKNTNFAHLNTTRENTILDLGIPFFYPIHGAEGLVNPLEIFAGFKIFSSFLCTPVVV